MLSKSKEPLESIDLRLRMPKYTTHLAKKAHKPIENSINL